MSKIKIYVMAHKAFEAPKDEIYIPMQVGSALHEKFGYVCDDTGDNISVKNPNYSELTGLYWLWRNEMNCVITGLCHYRRYFLDSMGNILNGYMIETLLENHDIILPRLMSYSYVKSIYDLYAEKHYSKDIDITREAISVLHPEYISAFDEVMNGNSMYYANMFIASKKIADEYSEWLFSILFYVEERTDMTGYDDYNRRVYGFIAERLMLVWVKYNRLRVCEADVGLVNEKSETHEAKLESGRLLSEGRYKEVLKYLDALLSKRPDVFLSDSDINSELSYIYIAADIMRIEENAGKNNLYNYSLDYMVLIHMFKKLRKMLENLPSDKSLYEYILNNGLSEEAVLVVINNVLTDKEDKIKAYNYLAGAYLDDGDIEKARKYVAVALKQQ